MYPDMYIYIYMYDICIYAPHGGQIDATAIKTILGPWAILGPFGTILGDVYMYISII